VTTGGATLLRPLGVGERIDAGIKLYVRSFRALAPALLSIAIPVALIDAALAAWSASTISGIGRFVTRNPDGSVSLHPSVFYGVIGSLVLSYVVLVLLWIPGKAVAYKAFGDVYLGRPTLWGEVLESGLRRLGSLLWIDVMVYLAPLLVLAAAGVVVFALVPLHALAIVLAIPPVALAYLFLIWWDTSCRLVGPTLMMEDIRGRRAIRRSLALVRGTWWSVFGTVLLAGLLFVIVMEVANAIVGVLAALAVPVSHLGPHAFVVTLVEQLLAVVVFIPLTCSIATVLSVDMRVRKEGLDLAMLSEGLNGGAAPGAYDFLPKPRMVIDPNRPPPTWPPPPPSPPPADPPPAAPPRADPTEPSPG
jgi:hypothetical protein